MSNTPGRKLTGTLPKWDNVVYLVPQQEKVQKDTSADNPDWVRWVSPIVDALGHLGPLTTRELRKELRSRRKHITGGILNGLSWLDNEGYIECVAGEWHLLERPRETKLTTKDRVRNLVLEVRASYGAETSDILGDVSAGPAVPARDELCGRLVEDGLHPLEVSRMTGLSAARVLKAAERWFFRKSNGKT